MRILFVLGIGLCRFTSMAQMAEEGIIDILENPAEIVQYEEKQLLKSTELKGEAYYMESPAVAILESASGRRYKARLNYNLGTNLIELYGNSETFIVNPKHIRRIETVDSTMTKRVFENTTERKGNNNPKVLMEVLADGVMVLLKEEEVTLSQATYFDRMGTGNRSRMYVSKAGYYLFNGSEYISVRNKRDFLEALADKKEQVKEFIKINRLNMRDERHMSYVVEYYNKISG